jgi:hypothetical protein
LRPVVSHGLRAEEYPLTLLGAIDTLSDAGSGFLSNRIWEGNPVRGESTPRIQTPWIDEGEEAIHTL